MRLAAIKELQSSMCASTELICIGGLLAVWIRKTQSCPISRGARLVPSPTPGKAPKFAGCLLRQVIFLALFLTKIGTLFHSGKIFLRLGGRLLLMIFLLLLRTRLFGFLFLISQTPWSTKLGTIRQ